MAQAPRAQLDRVCYTLGEDAVTIEYHIVEGSAAGTSGTLTTTETALLARLADQKAGTWGDPEILAEAQVQLDAVASFLTAALPPKVDP